MKEKTLVYGESLLHDATHRVQSINFNNTNKFIEVSIRKGIYVDVLKITMEKAQEIGFINVQALKSYLK